MSFSILNYHPNNQKPVQVPPSNIHYPAAGQQNLLKVEETHFWFTARRELVLRCLRDANLTRKKIYTGLDIGCGTGFTANWLTNQGFTVYGVDASPPILQGSMEENRFFSLDIFSITPTPEFDFILLLDVIEHIEDDTRFVEQALKFLKPGGVAIVSVPAFSWLWSPIDDQSQHLRRYSKSSLRAKLSTLRAHIDQEFYYYGSTLPLFFISRMVQRLFKKGISDEATPNSLVNGFLKMLLQLERALLPRGMPLGSSLFVQLRKPQN